VRSAAATGICVPTLCWPPPTSAGPLLDPAAGRPGGGGGPQHGDGRVRAGVCRGVRPGAAEPAGAAGRRRGAATARLLAGRRGLHAGAPPGRGARGCVRRGPGARMHACRLAWPALQPGAAQGAARLLGLLLPRSWARTRCQVLQRQQACPRQHTAAAAAQRTSPRHSAWPLLLARRAPGPPPVCSQRGCTQPWPPCRRPRAQGGLTAA
jgi:hypothetical protein